MKGRYARRDTWLAREKLGKDPDNVTASVRWLNKQLKDSMDIIQQIQSMDDDDVITIC